jgi:hypothetical protein
MYVTARFDIYCGIFQIVSDSVSEGRGVKNVSLESRKIKWGKGEIAMGDVTNNSLLLPTKKEI